MEWISVEDSYPNHMQDIKVFIENPFFGSFERLETAVFLWFDGMGQGEFYDSKDQSYLDYVTKWIPLPKPPKE